MPSLVFKCHGEILDSDGKSLPVVPSRLSNLRAHHGVSCPECGGNANSLTGWQNDTLHHLTRCHNCGFEFHYTDTARLSHPIDINVVQYKFEAVASRVMISGYVEYKKKRSLEISYDNESSDK